MEECCAENEGLKAELDLLRTRVQRSEPSSSEGLARDDPGTTPSSSQLDAGASVFSSSLLSTRRNHTPDSDDHSGSWTPSRGDGVEWWRLRH